MENKINQNMVCKMDLIKQKKSNKKSNSNQEHHITSFHMPISEKRCFVRKLSKFERHLTNLIEQIEQDKSKVLYI